ncbi:MAG: helix-turn-helix transcriptional regulator [Spirochaetia bacterium]|nr:helix-turn-helix transcriptional regulator [Spirochaetia bacterium]MCF7953070.1 helix-turn-helix transcriptional regulator [Spirochaetales bacterium]
MKTLKKQLETELKDNEFKDLYEEERELHSIAIKILETRSELGLSQKQLADKANITQQQLSKVENGVNCNMTTFLKVCHALKIKIDLEKVSA